MSPRRRAYLLTPTARRHLREARNWSLQHWGEDLTRQYFKDLDAGVRELAANHTRYRHRDELAGGTGLRLHPIREHYIVFEPLSKNQIVVVAVLRRGRDIPEILSRGHHLIVRELEAFRDHKKDGQ